MIFDIVVMIVIIGCLFFAESFRQQRDEARKSKEYYCDRLYEINRCVQGFPLCNLKYKFSNAGLRITFNDGEYVSSSYEGMLAFMEGRASMRLMDESLIKIKEKQDKLEEIPV